MKLRGLVILGYLFFTSISFASTNIWDGANANWSDSSHWSLGHEPAADEDCSVSAGGSIVITTPAMCFEMLFDQGEIIMNPGGSLTISVFVNAAGPNTFAFTLNSQVITILSDTSIHGAGNSILFSGGKIHVSTGTFEVHDLGFSLTTIEFSGACLSTGNWSGSVIQIDNGAVVSFATDDPLVFTTLISTGSATIQSEDPGTPFVWTVSNTVDVTDWSVTDSTCQNSNCVDRGGVNGGGNSNWSFVLAPNTCCTDGTTACFDHAAGCSVTPVPNAVCAPFPTPGCVTFTPVAPTTTVTPTRTPSRTPSAPVPVPTQNCCECIELFSSCMQGGPTTHCPLGFCSVVDNAVCTSEFLGSVCLTVTPTLSPSLTPTPTQTPTPTDRMRCVSRTPTPTMAPVRIFRIGRVGSTDTSFDRFSKEPSEVFAIACNFSRQMRRDERLIEGHVTPTVIGGNPLCTTNVTRGDYLQPQTLVTTVQDATDGCSYNLQFMITANTARHLLCEVRMDVLTISPTQ